MDKIKEIGGKALDWIVNWTATNWNGGIFNRGKVIFAYGLILIILLGLITKK
jgi:hypothetical protein